MKPAPSILIVKLSSIGDVVMSTPVPQAIKDHYPDARVCWLVEELSRPIVDGNPAVDRVFTFPKARWTKMLGSGLYAPALREVRGFLRELRAERFDIAIDLQGLLRSGILTWLSGARRRIGRADAREGAGAFLTERVRPRPRYVRAAQQYLELLRPLGIVSSNADLQVPVSERDERFADEYLETALGRRSRPFATIAASTTFYHKHWPEESFAEVIERLYQEHGLRSVLLGSARDLESQSRLAAMTTAEPVLAGGATTLNQAAALIRRSSLLVAVDTGLLYVGLAMKTPTVGIFGPTTFEHLSEEQAVVAYRPFRCAPCLRKATCEDRDCMRALTADDVMRAVSQKLGVGLACLSH